VYLLSHSHCTVRPSGSWGGSLEQLSAVVAVETKPEEAKKKKKKGGKGKKKGSTPAFKEEL
jgi:hypothetical protein